MRKLGWMSVVAASAMITAGACSTLGKAVFENPVVSLKDVKLRGVGLTGGTLDVQLAVYNPNNFRLDATQMTYKLSMAGDSITVADGVLSDRFTVQDRDTARVTIPVNFTYAGLGAAGRSLLNTGAVNYNVTGVVSVGSPLGSVNVPYRSSGRFTATGTAR